MEEPRINKDDGDGGGGDLLVYDFTVPGHQTVPDGPKGKDTVFDLAVYHVHPKATDTDTLLPRGEAIKAVARHKNAQATRAIRAGKEFVPFAMVSPTGKPHSTFRPS